MAPFDESIDSLQKTQLFFSALAGWFLLWGIAAALPLERLHLSRYQLNDLRNRMVSFIHGLLGLLLSAY